MIASLPKMHVSLLQFGKLLRNFFGQLPSPFILNQ